MERQHRATGGLPGDEEIPVAVESDKDFHTLVEYSEWLDGQGLVIGDGEPVTNSIPRKLPGEDMRTHTDLVVEFLDDRQS